MAWVLVVATAVLAALVLALTVLVLRLARRVRELESGPLAASAPAHRSVAEPHAQPHDEPAPEFVITRVGKAEPVRAVPAPVFADLVLKETVVQTASLFHGLRRALAPETRNRIRFHVRQEVKRSRKQRRTELREVRREWAARQRAAMAAEPAEEPAA